MVCEMGGKTNKTCWKSKDKLISDILLWTHPCCFWLGTGCLLENLSRVMTERDIWWERVKEIYGVGDADNKNSKESQVISSLINKNLLIIYIYNYYYQIYDLDIWNTSSPENQLCETLSLDFLSCLILYLKKINKIIIYIYIYIYIYSLELFFKKSKNQSH